MVQRDDHSDLLFFFFTSRRIHYPCLKWPFGIASGILRGKKEVNSNCFQGLADRLDGWMNVCVSVCLCVQDLQRWRMNLGVDRQDRAVLSPAAIQIGLNEP